MLNPRLQINSKHIISTVNTFRISRFLQLGSGGLAVAVGEVTAAALNGAWQCVEAPTMMILVALASFFRNESISGSTSSNGGRLDRFQFRKRFREGRAFGVCV